MKYSEIMASIPRLLTAKDAEDYVAGPTMLDDLRTHHGLAPIERRKGLTVYDRNDIDSAIERKKMKDFR